MHVSLLSSGHGLSCPQKTSFCDSCPCGDVTDEIWKLSWLSWRLHLDYRSKRCAWSQRNICPYSRKRGCSPPSSRNSMPGIQWWWSCQPSHNHNSSQLLSVRPFLFLLPSQKQLVAVRTLPVFLENYVDNEWMNVAMFQCFLICSIYTVLVVIPWALVDGGIRIPSDPLLWINQITRSKFRSSSHSCSEKCSHKIPLNASCYIMASPFLSLVFQKIQQCHSSRVSPAISSLGFCCKKSASSRPHWHNPATCWCISIWMNEEAL